MEMKCPFCKKTLKDITARYLPTLEIWVVSHACHEDGEDEMHTGYITICGKTEDEAIERFRSGSACE